MTVHILLSESALELVLCKRCVIHFSFGRTET
jgi:hypothetical protein